MVGTSDEEQQCTPSKKKRASSTPVKRKGVGKNGTVNDASTSTPVKGEADSDGGEEVVFRKKPRHETVSANKRKSAESMPKANVEQDETEEEYSTEVTTPASDRKKRRVKKAAKSRADTAPWFSPLSSGSLSSSAEDDVSDPEWKGSRRASSSSASKEKKRASSTPVKRKAVGKNCTVTDASTYTRVKGEADSDGGEEVVFGKKPRNETVSANDQNPAESMPKENVEQDETEEEYSIEVTLPPKDGHKRRVKKAAKSRADTATWSSPSSSGSCSSEDASDPEWKDPQQDSSRSASDSSFSESEVPDDTEEARNKWLSKNRMISWEPTEAETLRYMPATRLPEGPTAYAIRRISDIQSCLDLFLTEDISQLVLKYSNLHGRRTYGDGWGEITMTELRAFFGLLILAGVYRSRYESTKSLWAEGTGRAIFPATMSCQNFAKIAAILRFDDKVSRQRRLNNKLAAILPVWEKWEPRLPLMYNPGVDVCVDEQLVPFRGRCPFRQYIPSKPARYGMKVWVLCDARTSYAWKMQVYTGKQDGASRETNQGKRVVLDLVEGLKGHTVTCDNFFTSYELGEELLKRKIAMVGTIRRSKPELPPKLLEIKQRANLSSLFAFSKNHTAVSYVPRRGKNVILLSTKHREPAISNEHHRKPKMILDYNRNKGGVDNLDKVLGTYSCRRKSQRWPLTMFFNILDVSAYNAFVLWTFVDPLWKERSSHRRRLFLEELGKAMVTPLMQQRQRLPRNPSAVRAVNAARAEQQEEQESDDQKATSRRRQKCHFCRKRIRNTCCKCEIHICRAHTSMLCKSCCSSV